MIETLCNSQWQSALMRSWGKNVTTNNKKGSSSCGKTSLILFLQPSSISDKLRYSLQVETWRATCWCVRSVWVIPFFLTMTFDWVETVVSLLVWWVMIQIHVEYSSQNSWDRSALCLYQFDPRFPLAKSPLQSLILQTSLLTVQ